MSPRAVRQWIEQLRPQVVVVDPTVLPPAQWRWLGSSADGFSIVVWSTRSSATERIRALRWGVECWLAKPVAPEELLATLEKLVGAVPAGKPPDAVQRLQAGELELELDSLTCRIHGSILHLTEREFKLLNCLAARYGRLVEGEQLFIQVWGGNAMTEGERSVDVLIGRLRGKLATASPGWRYIHTRRRVGYWLQAIPVIAAADAQPADL